MLGERRQRVRLAGRSFLRPGVEHRVLRARAPLGRIGDRGEVGTRDGQPVEVVVEPVAGDQQQLVRVAQPRRRDRVERVERAAREARRESLLARDEAREHVGHHRARRERRSSVRAGLRGGALAHEALRIVVAGAHQRVAVVLREGGLPPPLQPDARGARHLHEPAEPVGHDPGRHADLLDLVGGRGPMVDAQPGQRPAAGERRHRLGEPASVIGLLVQEIAGVEQDPRRVDGSLRRRAREEWIGLGPTGRDAHELTSDRAREGWAAGPA